MSRLKATVTAMQPKTLDYTRFARARSVSRAPDVVVSTEDAAGAMAFSRDALGMALLRLAPARQRNRVNFSEAANALMERYCIGPIASPSQPRNNAICLGVVTAVLHEWVYGCPRCRGRKEDQAPKGTKGMICPTCRNSGIAEVKPRDRMRLVNECLHELDRFRSYEDFKSWHGVYASYLGKLRGLASKMGVSLNYGDAANDDAERA